MSLGVGARGVPGSSEVTVGASPFVALDVDGTLDGAPSPVGETSPGSGRWHSLLVLAVVQKPVLMV